MEQKEITAKVKEGDILAVNGIEGDVIVHPTDEQKLNLKKSVLITLLKSRMGQTKNAETVTADGKHFELAANIGTLKRSSWCSQQWW